MKTIIAVAVIASAIISEPRAYSEEEIIEIQANRVLHPISRLLTGACIEDVNHEIYGGIYSQMIFGESFQEPPSSNPPRGFKAFGGQWNVHGDELIFRGAAGDKLVSNEDPFENGKVGVEIFMADKKWSNVGLIVRTANAGPGVDRFDGYEIALNAADQILRLGRHRQNWELIKDVPCKVPVGQWSSLVVKLEQKWIEISLNGITIVRHQDGDQALFSGTVGLRAFQGEARYRKLWINTGGQRRELPFQAMDSIKAEVSQMWRPLNQGKITGSWEITKNHPFVGMQSQQLTFESGQGAMGIENQGLNRWGLYFAGRKQYEGLLWARTENPVDLFISVESADGATIHAGQKLSLKPGDWQRYEFSLTPKATETRGRFAIKLKQPGSVTLGYVYLQPGEWGRFKGLPIRRDVVEGLIDQGITVLRYGGSMVNNPEYRWKKMIGPRDRRSPYRGHWYPYSSNGWGILDFMDFCEAAGFEYIPAFFMGESPEDMADFVQYAKGSEQTEWGRRRAADGHPTPYQLKYIQLGNEERVDESYWQKFEPMAKAIWAWDPNIILVVGDFFYGQPIQDPYNFGGGSVKTLAAHKKILDLARKHDREVWFDIHIGTEQPPQPGNLAGERSFIDQLGKLSPGARFKVVIFEFNAGNHSQKRALSNALAINLVERDGRIPIALSANCLQPDGQNDNDWNQGLLFLNPSQTWLQPPGYVTQMYSRHYMPELVQCHVTAGKNNLDVNAKLAEDGKRLVLQAVNPTDKPVASQIRLSGFAPQKAEATVTELSGPLEARNTAARPDAITPQVRQWRHSMLSGSAGYTFPVHSVTVIMFE